MKLGNGASPALTVTAVDADSIVTEAKSFASSVRKGQMVKTIRSVYHMRDGMLMGVSHATYANGDTASFRTNASKKASK